MVKSSAIKITHSPQINSVNTLKYVLLYVNTDMHITICVCVCMPILFCKLAFLVNIILGYFSVVAYYISVLMATYYFSNQLAIINVNNFPLVSFKSFSIFNYYTEISEHFGH